MKQNTNIFITIKNYEKSIKTSKTLDLLCC